MKEIHKWLKDQGTTVTNKQRYRLIQNTNLTEKRSGEFNDFSESGLIFLRTVRETRETQKYSYIPKFTWILEVFCEGPSPEIDTSEGGGSYEPLWVFLDKNNNYLEPNLKVVQFIVNFSRTKTNLSPGERKALLDKAEDREVAQFMGMLEDEGRTPIESLLHTREAVSMHISEKGKKITQKLFGDK
jgi:hypothetical protein